MPNTETPHLFTKVDEKLAAILMSTLLPKMAAEARGIEHSIMRLNERDDTDAMKAVLLKDYDNVIEQIARLEELVDALCADRVRIVKEGALVHAIAERLAFMANAHGGYEGDAKKGKEEYIGTSQGFLRHLHTKEVII